MILKEKIEEIREEIEEGLFESKCTYFTLDQFAELFWIRANNLATSPYMGANVYFGRDENDDSEFVIRIVQPFDACGIIVLINRTLGGDLFAKECREDDEMQFVANCIYEYCSKRGFENDQYYLDYGWFKYEVNNLAKYSIC